jgi:dihydroorotase
MRVEGRLVSEERVWDGSVEIDEVTGLIVDVGEKTGQSDVDTLGCLIFPGFGDIHIHAREDASGQQTYKEDFATASAAAVHGGVVQVADMPNNVIAPVNDALYAAKELLTAKSDVHVTLYAGIGPETQPLMRHVPYKAFMGPSVGDLFFTGAEQLENAIARYRGRNVSFHCEDPVVMEAHRGEATHEERRPAAAEVSATALALQLIEKYELVGKLCHYSTREGLPMILAAKRRGVKVTAEVTPHHLYFDGSMLTEQNRLWLQMNPPLRSTLDRLAMLTALRHGDIDYVASDHAPHSHEEKRKGASGVPHLDTMGAFATWLIKNHGYRAQDVCRVFATNPGKWVKEFLPAGMGKGFGRIEAGYVGSLTVLDMDTPYTVTRESVKTKCAWSPFEGVTFPGSVRATVIRGKVFPNA